MKRRLRIPMHKCRSIVRNANLMIGDGGFIIGYEPPPTVASIILAAVAKHPNESPRRIAMRVGKSKWHIERVLYQQQANSP